MPARPDSGNGADDDDRSTSPHVNTLRELSKSSSTPPPDFEISPNPSSESNNSGDQVREAIVDATVNITTTTTTLRL